MLDLGQKEYKRTYAINFDLDTHRLRQFYSNTNPENAYRDIAKYMERNGFIHRQWSGYVSKKTMTQGDLFNFTINLYNHFPWLIHCVNKMDATIVLHRSYDLQVFMQQRITSQQQLQQQIAQQQQQIQQSQSQSQPQHTI